MRKIREEIVSSHRAHDPSLSEDELQERADEIIRRDMVGDCDMLLTPENISLLGMPTSMRFNFDLLRHMYKTVVYSEAQDFLTSDAPVVWVDPAQYPRDEFAPFLSLGRLRRSNLSAVAGVLSDDGLAPDGSGHNG